MFKTLIRHLAWTDQTDWQWPEQDMYLAERFGDANDIDKIMDHVPHRNTCVQAGGACGVWPKRFAQLFKTVYTFEPNRESYECLLKNTPEMNVYAFPCALGKYPGMGRLNCAKMHLDNLGAWYLEADPSGDVPVDTIDAFDLVDVDLIQLDVEGSETEVLEGAYNTIERDRPVIVVEQKPLFHQKEPTAGKFLKTLGYREVARIRKDVVYEFFG